VGFSDIIIPLIFLTHKDTPFAWGPDHTQVSNTLKEAFTQAPILAHSPDDSNIHPITFYSCSMQLAELNYEIYDKELLAIFKAF